MSYQVIKPNNDPVYLDFMKHKIAGKHKPLEEYEHYYKCEGLWNNGCNECTLDELKRMINWMCTGDAYESSDGKSIFIHGFSQSDMW